MNITSKTGKSQASPRWATAILYLTVFGLAPLSLAQDQHDHDEVDEGEHEVEVGHDEHAESIQLTPEDMHDFGILVATAGPGIVREVLRLPGEIRMNENAMAHISPRFEGIVKAVHKRLGDEVRARETLAEMESNDTLRPFELTSPIDGTVVSFHLTLGESLEAGDYAFIVADTSMVWADLRVYQRDLPKIKSGLEVQISAGHVFPNVTGTIAYLGPVVDEATRTGLARVIFENPDGIYRPGLFVIGNIVIDEADFPVVIPLSALHSLDGETSVYVESETGEGFAPREVSVGHRDNQNVEIRKGLGAGERYVIEGGFFLKADSQKEKFGDGHDH